MNQIRAFIALDLPPSIQDAIENQSRPLRQAIGDEPARWVSARNMHLSLKFLGDVPISHLDFIKQMLTQAADSHPRFDLQIGGLGSFPTSKRPRVLWVGIHAPAALVSLQNAIETGAVRLGYEKEARPFSPHLTLARIRQGIGAGDLQKIRAAVAKIQLGRIGTASVDSVHLYQSDLHSGGSVYTKLHSAPLR